MYICKFDLSVSNGSEDRVETKLSMVRFHIKRCISNLYCRGEQVEYVISNIFLRKIQQTWKRRRNECKYAMYNGIFF